MNPLPALLRPSWFEAAVDTVSIAAGFGAVLGAGLASAALAVLSAAVGGGGPAALSISAALPVLFILYWLLQAYLVDAAAGMVGRSGRRRLFLAVSGFAFPSWVVYAVLGLGEAVAVRYAGGSGAGLASVLQWVRLPVLVWFLTLTTFAVRAVYRITTLSAFAFALLPYALLAAALLLVSLVFTALHLGGLA